MRKLFLKGFGAIAAIAVLVGLFANVLAIIRFFWRS
jgi:hypothetical protein